MLSNCWRYAFQQLAVCLPTAAGTHFYRCGTPSISPMITGRGLHNILEPIVKHPFALNSNRWRYAFPPLAICYPTAGDILSNSCRDAFPALAVCLPTAAGMHFYRCGTHSISPMITGQGLHNILEPIVKHPFALNFHCWRYAFQPLAICYPTAGDILSNRCGTHSISPMITGQGLHNTNPFGYYLHLPIRSICLRFA